MPVPLKYLSLAKCAETYCTILTGWLTISFKLEQYFEDPADTSIAWIGLLFGLLTIAMQSYKRTDTAPPDIDTAPAMTELYRIRAAQCIQIGMLTWPVGTLLRLIRRLD